MAIRLLVVAEGYPWGENLAGVFHRDQLRRMAAAGLDVTVLGATPWVPPMLERINPRWRLYRDPPKRQTDGDIKIVRPRYPAFPRENEFMLPDFSQYLAARMLNLPRPDVIQAFYALPPGALARRLAHHWDVPYLVGMLGDDVNLYPHHNSRNLRVLREVVADAAFAFANGPTLAQEAERLTGREIEALSIGASPERFSDLPGQGEARERLGLPANKFIALYVGALSEAKGTRDLAQALDRIDNPSLLCVAVGDGALRGELAACRNALCLGVRSSKDVVLAMAAADLLVHPSHSEGLPTALVEAGFAGLPILTTDARGCIDLARGNRAFVVPAKNPEMLARRLAEIAANPDAPEMQQHAEAMSRHVAEHYSLDRNTDKLIERYRALAGKAA